VLPGGYCWRHEDTLVESREIEQWFLKTTRYAEQLLEDLKELEGGWPERVIPMQRNWIGKSIGARVKFPVADVAGVEPIEVFTTRIDTIYGASAIILAPTHPLVQKLIAGSSQQKDAQDKIAQMRQTSVKAEDLATAEKVGIFTGRYAINPFNQEKLPIWAANFVLMEYGTGAIMAVPAHDERDFEFATKYGLPKPVVVIGSEGAPPPVFEGGSSSQQTPVEQPFTDYGKLVNSGPYSGLRSDEAILAM